MSSKSAPQTQLSAIRSGCRQRHARIAAREIGSHPGTPETHHGEHVWRAGSLTLHTAHRSGGIATAAAANGRTCTRVLRPLQTADGRLAARLRAYRRPDSHRLVNVTGSGGSSLIAWWPILLMCLPRPLTGCMPRPTVLLNLADDKLNADADKKIVEPVLSPNFEHAGARPLLRQGHPKHRKARRPRRCSKTVEKDATRRVQQHRR